MSALPILYSFRRCPYAMRARMALWVAGVRVELREVKLAAKPPELIAASSKATVPVLVLADGTVIDESLAIMRWALAQNDPEGWLAGDEPALIAVNDGAFKHHLDRAKYPGRYEEDGATDHRTAALALLEPLEARLAAAPCLCGETRSLTDIARAMIDAYNAQDVDAYVSFMTDDACEANYRGDVVREGREGTRSGLAAAFARWPGSWAWCCR